MSKCLWVCQKTHEIFCELKMLMRIKFFTLNKKKIRIQVIRLQKLSKMSKLYSLFIKLDLFQTKKVAVVKILKKLSLQFLKDNLSFCDII